MRNILLLFILIFVATTGYCQDSLRFIIAKETVVNWNRETKNGERFTPTLSEIDTVDKYLKKFFPLENKDYTTYFRQYIGLWINEGKVIYVIGGCDKGTMIAHGKVLLPPLHGGECYFSARCFLSAKYIDSFHVYGNK